MSSTFSAKAGSLERLKVRQRWGCSLWVPQMRWTVLSDRFTALAMARPVQWVVSPGGSALVRASTLATVGIATRRRVTNHKRLWVVAGEFRAKPSFDLAAL